MWLNTKGWSGSDGGWEKVAAAAGRTTLFTYNDFRSTAGWTVNAGSVPAANQTDPDGGSAGYTFTANGASAAHNVARTQSITASATTVYRVRANRGTITRFNMREDQQTGKGSIFDLVAGTVVANLVGAVGTITSLGGGWYLCETQFVAAASTFSGFRVGLLPATAVDLSNETTFTSSDTLFLYKAEVQTIP